MKKNIPFYCLILLSSFCLPFIKLSAQVVVAKGKGAGIIVLPDRYPLELYLNERKVDLPFSFKNYPFKRRDITNTTTFYTIYKYEDYEKRYNYCMSIIKKIDECIESSYCDVGDITGEVKLALDAFGLLQEKEHPVIEIFRAYSEYKRVSDLQRLRNQIYALSEENNQMYRANSTPKPRYLMQEFRQSSGYKDNNPVFMYEFGYLLGKSRLNDDWRQQGSKTSFSMNAFITISPEIRWSPKVTSRLYANASYERLVYDLSEEKTYHIGSSYVKNPQTDFYQLQESKDIGLAIRQLGTGLTIFTATQSGFAFDLGAGMTWYHNGYLIFGDAKYLSRIELQTKRFNDVLKGNYTFPGRPYGTLGISIRGNEVLYFRLSGTLQKMDITSTDNLHIYNLLSTTTPEYQRLSLIRPQDSLLFSAKLYVGIRF